MIAGGANQTITGIPFGTQCTVTEAGTPAVGAGYAWQTPIYTPSQTVTINPGGGAISVGVENPIQGSGSLQITKTVTGDTAGYTAGTTFTMTVDCTDDTFDQTVMIAGGANQTITGIPLGTQCTVTETSTPAPAAGYAWQTPVYTPSQTVTVNVAGGSVSVGVENPIQGSGSLQISKTRYRRYRGIHAGHHLHHDGGLHRRHVRPDRHDRRPVPTRPSPAFRWAPSAASPRPARRLLLLATLGKHRSTPRVKP